MRRWSFTLSATILLGLAACQEQDPAAAAAALAQFEGAYSGTGRGLLATCPMNNVFPLSGEVRQGRLSLRFAPGWTATGRVEPDGSIRDLRLSSNAGWTGTSSGSGQIQGTSLRIDMSTVAPNGNMGCPYIYEAQRQG